MTITSFYPVIKKDFKVQVFNNRINKISVNIFDNVFMGQPLYKMNKEDWNIWFIIYQYDDGRSRCQALFRSWFRQEYKAHDKR